MRFRDVGEARRAFLAGLVGAGGLSVAGCTRCARPSTPPFDLTPSDDPYAVETVEETIVLRSGEALADRCFVLSEKFRSAGSANALIVVEGDDVGIRNVRIVGADQWHPDWEDAGTEAGSRSTGVGKTAGIRVENVRDVAVEQISIEGLPGVGIFGHGIEGGVFRDVTVRHCDGGIHLLPGSASRALRFERIYTENLWGPVDERGRPGDASREPPDGWIGGAGLALDSLRDSVVVDCTAVGEMRGSFALTNPRGVRIQGARGANLVIRGSEGPEPRPGGVAAREVVVVDCFLDKGLGRGTSLFDASCVSLSRNVESVEIRDCVLNAAGHNGHAIEVGPRVRARISGCLIRGFNGVRGSEPAHALALSDGGEVNDDFARVNHFVDQARIRLGHAPAPR